MACQASALPLSFGPINRIKGESSYPKLVRSQPKNFRSPKNVGGQNRWRRWLGVRTDLGGEAKGIVGIFLKKKVDAVSQLDNITWHEGSTRVC